MARSHSPSSSQDPTNPRLPPPPAARRLPPPCWSHDETVALIDAYRDKWYSLRRGNLRAPHWQEVADGVAARCPSGHPPKTAVQCRHKMEKLRKRYRSEIQRVSDAPKGQRYPSSWVHFKRMDSMELGSSSSDPSVDPIDQNDEEDEDENPDDLMLYPKGIKPAIALPLNPRYHTSNGVAGTSAGNGNGVRIKLPNIAAAVPPLLPPPSGLTSNRSYDDYPPSMYRNGYMKEAFGGVGGRKRASEMEVSHRNPVDDMVAAIQALGDGFVKVERMKMDMARELESMRMKMEMKRTEMILESHQKLVDSFSRTVAENKNKKIKRIPSPES